MTDATIQEPLATGEDQQDTSEGQRPPDEHEGEAVGSTPGALILTQAAELVALKLAEALSPMFHALTRRLERLEQRLELPPGEDDELSSGLCAAPGCTRPARARGLCSAHYQRIRYQERKVSVLAPEEGSDPDAKRCSVEGCGRLVKARGLCSAHYQRLLYRERRGEE